MQKYNDKNEPIFNIPFDIEVTRQDHSLCMTLANASITDDETGDKADINYIVGGIGVILMVKRKNGDFTSYRIKFNNLIKAIFEKTSEFDKAKKIERKPSSRVKKLATKKEGRL